MFCGLFHQHGGWVNNASIFICGWTALREELWEKSSYICARAQIHSLRFPWLGDCAERLRTFMHECGCAVLYAFMHAGKRTYTNRSATEGSDVHRAHDTHTCTTGAAYLSSATRTRPGSLSPSSASHVMSSSLTLWLLTVTETFLPVLWLFL